ncbi:hypothetical protein LTR07_003262 [Exophiala xenobiotica]|nr:hypothetical protein LTR79_004233 [Exophiala xenobiotica]KAK5498197.1 hypothetical protein LTR26_001597 [Exophiala xenobiotica]KAK5503995.1 hypothetical protein LTR83_001920 [Exophiala xenobiotica]KAK5516486.1 hypothetical protein LTR21_004172 [Exophiala xenobiotica]KAK5523590.1 hypothetical protein LTR07_003262 [Exophiala xenobiotica]
MDAKSTTASGNGLQVGIVGAGVAGLSAAIALRRIGHDVEVFERSQFRNENGAAVSIPPNGGRILQYWGFDAVKAGGIENIQARRPKGDTLEPMAPTLSFANVEQQFGNKWYFYHRVDMHRHLREMAEAAGSTIRLGAQVTDVDPETGIISLKDGSHVQKDLVIVADGQHDRLNVKITGKEVPMKRSGQTAYRCLIPMADILADEETAPLFENQAPGFWAPALPAKGVMAVTYPCRNNEILNVLAVHRKLGQHATVTEQDDAVIEDWNFPATHDDLERVLDGFHPSVKKVFLKSPEVKVYTQMKREPLCKMTKGKAVLIGDACHPMLLTHAQGVSSSIEDAAALEIFLADVQVQGHGDADASEKLNLKLQQRLEQFEKFRLPRVSATQILTDPVVPGPQAAAKYAAQEAEIRKYYAGPLPPTGAMPHSPPICQFFFGYDVRKKALEYLEAEAEADKTAAAAAAAATSTTPTFQVSEQLASIAEADDEAFGSVEIAAALAPTTTHPSSDSPKPVVVETGAAAPVVQEKAIVQVISGATSSDPHPQTSMEKRILDLENKLADMEKKLSHMMIQVSTTEVQPTPPQSPPAHFDTQPLVFSS